MGIVGTVAAVVTAAAGSGLSDQTVATTARASHPLPLTARVATLSQTDLLDEGRVTLRIRGRRRVAARVTVAIRQGGTVETADTPARVRLRAGGRRRLSFALPEPARALVAGCEPTRITVTAARTRAASGVHLVSSRRVAHEPPRCGRFFGPRSVWNTQVPADAALDPQSGAAVSAFSGEVERELRQGPKPTINTSTFSAPVYTVGRGQPLLPVTLDQPADHAPDLARAFQAVPVPPGARPAAGSDGHLVVWQPSRDVMWEFWRMHLAADGWHAAWGGRLDDVSSGPGHFASPTAEWGATATSLPLAGGLITTSELQRGDIPHALAMAVPHPRAGVFALPAQRSDGSSTSETALPEGAHLRLDPALDLDALSLSPPVLALARAAQRYGIIVRDGSGNVVLYGEDPTPLGTDPYPQLFGGQTPWDLLATFPWRSLQLMRMDLRKAPPPGLLGCGLICVG